MGRFLHPHLKITAGQQRARQISDDRRNLASYLLLSGDHVFSRFRLRLFQDIRKVKDTIRNDLLQWVQPPNSRGELRPVHDVLPAQNTVVNTTWLGLDYTRSKLKIKNTLRWQLYHQLDSDKALALRSTRDLTTFFGLINKAEYRIEIASLTLIPGWKSEFRRFNSFTAGEAARRELSQIAMLIVRKPVMFSTFIETGVEYHRFIQLQDPTPPRANDDFSELTALFQMTDISDYQGYRLTTVLGFSLSRLDVEVEDPSLNTRGFITVYAGIE
jgi:hypothetical protein